MSDYDGSWRMDGRLAAEPPQCDGLRSDAGGEVSRWADAAQYRSEPMPRGVSGRLPVVTLLNATPDPLGSIAALCGIYGGRVVRSLSDLTDDDRRKAFADMTKTVLSGPLSAVQFHFLIEGVDRSFTHQAVRQSIGTFFAQESLRFAVVDDEKWIDRTTLPPYLSGTQGGDALGAESNQMEYQRNIWDQAIDTAHQSYRRLIDTGMPAEEARGLMPHAIQTRYHYVTNLKGLLQEAGKRTCTQAQFHWRIVFGLIAKTLREYGYTDAMPSDSHRRPGAQMQRVQTRSDAWQFELIADELRPNCYQTGSCGFMAKFDRGCTIRARVELNAKAGRPSSEWDLPRFCHPDGCDHPEVEIPSIDPREWAADPGAART